MAAVSTDQSDYHFNEVALITGREFAPNELVQLQVTHVVGSPGSNEDAQNAPWTVQADATGSLNTTWSVTDPDAIRASYVLTARGTTSGAIATTNFTDGATDVQAWRNLAAGADKWTSSTLNGNNSTYNEGEFVPFRFTDLSETAGSTHTIVLTYDFTNSQAVHMWDFIGSFNATVAADLTVGLTSPGSASTWLLPTDPTLPSGTQNAAFLTTYNISSLSITGPTVVGDRKALTITFTVASGGGNKDIVIGFGGHLAREFTWGTNKGSSDFPGGSGKVYVSFDGSSDDNASLNPGQVVQDVNDPPVAVNDSVTTSEDTFLDIPVLANDLDVDTANGSLVVAAGSIGNVTGGTAVLLPDNRTVRFTPALNANNSNTPGGFSFTYRTSDGSLVSGNQAAVTISVTPVNDAPVAVADAFSTSEDQAIVLTSSQLTINDTDVDNTNAQLTVTAVSGATNGTVALSNGQITFTPALDFQGTAGFNYTVSDGAGGTAVAHVTITVTPQNDPPVVTATTGALLYTENDGAVAIDPALVLSDPDHASLTGATIALTGYLNGQDLLGFANQNGITGSFNASTGVLTLSGAATVAQYQAALRAVTYTNTSDSPSSTARTATFTVSDGTNIGAALRSITVIPVNDAPINHLPPPQSAVEDSAKVFSAGNGNAITISDVDAGSGNVNVALSVTNGTLTLGSLAGLSFSAGDGAADATMSFTGTITSINTALNGLTYTPTANFSGAASLTITTNDQGNSGTGTPLSDTDTLSITVNPVNDAPVANGDSVSTNEDTPKQITLVASDIDTAPAVLTYSIVDGPLHGALVQDTNGVYTYTPALNYTGPDSFTFRANDGALDSNVATVLINVVAVNDVPTANAQAVVTNQFTPKVITLTGGDVDGDTVSFKITSLPINGSLYVGNSTAGHLITATDLLGGGGYTISGAQVTYLPTADYFGSDAFGFVTNDILLDSASAVVSINVLDKTGPVITLGGSSGTETDDQTQSFTWNVADPSGLGPVSVSITRNGNSIFSTSAASGTFNFDSEGLGNYEISVVAADAVGNSANASRAAVVVDDDVDGPSIVLGGSTGAENDGQPQNFTWAISDPSGLSALSVVITRDGSPIFSTSNLADASGSFSFDTVGLGDFQISVSATDNDADRAADTAIATASRSVTVTDDDSTGPTIVLGGSTGTETDNLPQSFTWNIADPSGLSALSVVITRDGNEIFSTTNLADAIGSYSFDGEGLGVFAIQVTATDNDSDRTGDTAMSSASRSVTVNDDDVVAPVITLGGSQLTETDGDNQTFTWNVTDAGSGLSGVTVTITQDGDVIHTSSAVSGSFDFNSYGLGTFEISVSATDADADRPLDTLSNSASRSVMVGDDDSAAPVIVLGGSTGSEVDGVSNHFTWNISDAGSGLGSLSVVIRKDGGIIYQTSSLSDAIGSYNFDTDGLGTFTIDVSATDADADRASDALTATAFRSVTVTDDDVTSPTITLGGSQNSENDAQDQAFTWNVTDVSGLSGVTVTITQNGSVIHTSTATSGSFDFNSYGLGLFEISVAATDADNDRSIDSLSSSASRSVTVTDDDTIAPSIILGGSTGAETDGATNHFTWNISDAGSGVGSISVVIRKDGGIIYQTTDLANLVGDYSFDAAGLGNYTIDVQATDADVDHAGDDSGASASRSVTVTDDDTAGPVIVLNGSQNTETDGQDQVFTWNVSDVSDLSSVSVVITQDGNVIHTSSAASGSFDFNTYGLGTFQIVVNATDNDGDRVGDTSSNSGSRSVTVNDDDSAHPTIVLGGSNDAETDGATNHFTWDISDATSGLASINVVITRDDGNGPVVVYSTTALGNAVSSFNFDVLGLGTYQINVSATDADADRANDALTSAASRTVVVTDDDTAQPIITLGGSEGSENDGQNQRFTWSVADGGSGLGPVNVVITRNGNPILTSSDASGAFDFNSFGLGDFEISVTATDADNDRANDSVTATASRSVSVADDDTTGPLIVLGGSQNAENDGQTQAFSWNISDAGSGLGSISVVIRKDGGIIYQTTNLADAVGSYNFDSDGLGLFTIEATATDADADRDDDAVTSSASRSVTVTDDDTTGPVITLGGSQDTESDGQQQVFTWNVADPSGLSSVSVTITRNGNPIHTSTAAGGSFDFDGYGLGDFQISVIATDNDGDRTGDTVTSSASRSVTVVDDDINAPNIVLGGSEGVETDGETNYFTWNVSDGGSGLGELSVIIRRNGSIIYQTNDLADAVGSFNFDTYGLGSYTINVVAVDADGDRSEDSLSSADARVDVVEDDDVLPPTIILGGSQGSETDGQNQFFTWSISDASGVGSISVVVTRDGTPIFSSTDSAGTFSFNTNGLGDYQISAVATDLDSDRDDDALTASASRTVTVNDNDSTGPSIVLGGSQGSETDNQPQSFTWNISDPSGLSAISVVIRRNGGIVFQTSDLADAVGSFSFNHLGLGTFTIDVSATDNDGDRAGDTTSASASRSVTVTDDDSIAPLITLGGSTGSETDAATNHFTWSIADAGSGLGSIAVSVTKNGVEIFATTDLANATGSFDTYGPGTYAISVSATDADSDRPDDALGANDSRGVIVGDDDTAQPVINLGGSQNTENDGQDQAFTWNITDASGLSSVNVSITKNGSLIQSFNSPSGSFDFNSLGLGTYVITVNATDNDNDWVGDSLSASGSRGVTVGDDDIVAPVITLGGSQNTETDGDSNHFTWNVLDLGSGLDSFVVTVTRNGIGIFSTTTLASGSFNFDTFGLGNYQISVTASDNDHDWVGDQLSNGDTRSVVVDDDDTAPPQIILGGSQNTENDGQEQKFTWNVTDGSGLSGLSVIVTRNGVEIFSTTDLANAIGSFDFNSYGLGTYQLSVNATDNDGDRLSDSLTSSDLRSVIVSDDDVTPPQIVLGGSQATENDGQTQLFTWSIVDTHAGLDSFLVTITRNGVGIFSTTTVASGSFNFDTYGLGTYQISVTASDNDHDWVGDQLTSSDTRSVIVDDDDTTPPHIVLGGSQNAENDGQDQQFTWSVTDASALSNIQVTISKNGSVIQSFTDAAGSFDFNSLGLGTYDITVSAADNDNDWTGDISSTSQTRSVTVNDDDTAGPSIVIGGSTGAESDAAANHFTWSISDASNLSSLNITITKDGSTVFSTSELAQLSGDFSFDALGPGNYEIHISVIDDDSDWNGDRTAGSGAASVIVSDDDTAAPIIQTGGSQGSQNDGQDQMFTWNITDASGLSNLLVTVTRNGLPLFTSIDPIGSFDFNSAGLGNYEMSVTATDNDGDWVGDQLSNTAARSVVVTDDDVLAPTIALGGSTGVQNDGQDQKFTWSVSDASGLGGVTITVLKNGNPIFTSSNPSSEFDFNSLGLGSYQLVVSATDADTDWTGDATIATDSRTVTVNDDDTEAPVINLGGSQTSENDGQDQHFTWDVSDVSGFSALAVTVTRNGGTIFTSSAVSGSFDFNSFGLGDYQITVSATDADNDWTGDVLSNSASRNASVTDDDTTAPQILTGGSTSAETDGDTNHFTWNVSDASNLSSLTIIVGSSRVDLQACKLEYSIVSPK